MLEISNGSVQLLLLHSESYGHTKLHSFSSATRAVYTRDLGTSVIVTSFRLILSVD
jgi:hypothetical protein